MKKTLMALLLVSNITFADEMPKEMYMPNDSGGFMILTTDKCDVEYAFDLGFIFKVQATEGNGDIHEGCWNTISIPDHLVGRVEPYVNTWWEKGLTASYKQSLFSTEKKRWGN